MKEENKEGKLDHSKRDSVAFVVSIKVFLVRNAAEKENDSDKKAVTT